MASDPSAAAPRDSLVGSSLDAAAEAAANVRAAEEAAAAEGAGAPAVATTDAGDAAPEGENKPEDVEKKAEDGEKKPEEGEKKPEEGEKKPEAAEKFSEAARELAALWAQTAGLPDCAVIWLHGQGQTEICWQEIMKPVTSLGPAVGNCRWLWPRARVIPCTAFGGLPTSQWFDVPELPVCRVVRGVPDRPRKNEDAAEIEVTVARIHDVVDALQAEGVPAARIAIGGFDQGAAIAAHAVLRSPQKLAGGVMLGGWLPCIEQLKAAVSTAGLSTDLFWYHGATDAVVHPDMAAAHVQELEALGVHVDFSLALDLGHATNENMLQDLRMWLCDHLSAPLPGAEPEPDQSAAPGEAADSPAEVKATDAAGTAADATPVETLSHPQERRDSRRDSHNEFIPKVRRDSRRDSRSESNPQVRRGSRRGSERPG